MLCNKCGSRLRSKKSNFLVTSKIENYMVTMTVKECKSCKEITIPMSERKRVQAEIESQQNIYKKNKRKINKAVKKSIKEGDKNG